MGFFAYLGIAVFAYYALSFVSVLLKTMVLSGPKITKKYGEWAVVTGATDGVGKAMCFELARKGCRCARAACAPPATVLTAPTAPTVLLGSARRLLPSQLPQDSDCSGSLSGWPRGSESSA